MSAFDTMQVCLNGHRVTEFYEKLPKTRKNECDKCGEATVTQCPSCHHTIKGGIFPNIGNTQVPKTCEYCGNPFPWAIATPKPSKNDMKLELVRKIQNNFTDSDWVEVGLITDTEKLINNHDRLLNSLRFQDTDYLKSIVDVINQIEKKDAGNLQKIASFTKERYPETEEGEFISSPRATNKRKIVFAPLIFDVPETNPNEKTVAVIFPFELITTYNCIKEVCNSFGVKSVKANDFANSDTFMQNVFNMIYTCKVAVCDFTDNNMNVLYETGIVHTLGKEIIAITQSLNNIPSDLRHINMIGYSNTEAGYRELKEKLKEYFEKHFPNDLPF